MSFVCAEYVCCANVTVLRYDLCAAVAVVVVVAAAVAVVVVSVSVLEESLCCGYVC